jgi:hypothetical protein
LFTQLDFPLFIYFGNRKSWPVPDADDDEELDEHATLVVDILTLWDEVWVDNTQLEKISFLGDRLRSSDLCLIHFYKKAKALLVSWDFTCFGTVPPNSDISRSKKKTVDMVNIAGTMKRIADSRLNGKRKKIEDDPRYIAPDPEDNSAHRDGTQKRVGFTTEEDKAIMDGYAEFPSKWGKIKLHRAQILRNRTSAQIKDRVRHLKNADLIQYRAVVGGKHV